MNRRVGTVIDSSVQESSRPRLLFRDLYVPSTFNAAFDTLIRWTLLRVRCQRSVHFMATALGNIESIAKMNPGDLQHTVDLLNIAFYVRRKIFS